MSRHRTQPFTCFVYQRCGAAHTTRLQLCSWRTQMQIGTAGCLHDGVDRVNKANPGWSHRPCTCAESKACAWLFCAAAACLYAAPIHAGASVLRLSPQFSPISRTFTTPSHPLSARTVGPSPLARASIVIMSHPGKLPGPPTHRVWPQSVQVPIAGATPNANACGSTQAFEGKCAYVGVVHLTSVLPTS